MSGPISPNQTFTDDDSVNRSVNQSMNVTGRSSALSDSLRRIRSGGSGRPETSLSPRGQNRSDSAARQKARFQARAKLANKTNLNRTAELLRQNEEKDQKQSRFVSAARERRQAQAQMEKLSKSLQYAKKKQTAVDMVSEVEQDKFFHFTFYDEKPEPEQDPHVENVEDLDDDLVPLIPKSAIKTPDTFSTSWAEKADEESSAGLYVLPGKEAHAESLVNAEIAKKEREHDGIFTGSEPVISSNLRAWLTRDNWIENGTPYYVEDTVYSYPIRQWTLAYEDQNSHLPIKEPQAYLAEAPLAQTRKSKNETYYELNLRIENIKFTHHHFMSEEHKIQARLVVNYENYVTNVRKHESSKVAESLTQYRLTWLEKKNRSANFQGLPDSPSKLSVSNILDIVSDLRERRNIELSNIKSSFDQVLSTWGELEQQRHQQGFMSTRAKVTVFVLAAPENDREIWNSDIRDELEEKKAQHYRDLEEYHVKYRDYKRAKKNRPEDSTDPLPLKPTKVDEWDENQVLNKIMHEALDTRRNPTESVKTLSLEFNGNVDSDENIGKIHSQERARRENLRKSKYTVKVFYNNLEVSVFSKIQIDSDFALAPLEQTVVRSVDVPKIVKVEIFESGMIRDRQIAYFSIYLPPANATEKFPLQKVTEFHNQERDQEWIGLCRYTSFWGEDKETGVALVPSDLPNTLAMSHRNRDINDPRLINLSQEIDDPNDPEYVPLDDAGSQIYSGFILNPYLKDGNFASCEELDRNKRLRILQLRNDEVAEFRGRTMVPLREHEIQDAEFQSYEERIKNDLDTTVGPDGLPLDAKQIIRRKRKRMKELVIQRLRAASKNVNYSDIIREDPMPDFGGLVKSLGRFFEATRPLKPERKERSRTAAPVQNPKIIVSVRGAQNLPIRKVVTDDELTRSAMGMFGRNQPFHSNLNVTGQFGHYSGLHQTQMNNSLNFFGDLNNEMQELRPFISISFGGKTERTSGAFGANPSWNEQIELDLPEGLSRGAQGGLPQMKKEEFIFLNVFDEKITKETDGDEQISHSSKHWLGGTAIPLSTILLAGKVEGQVAIQGRVPPLLMGYTVGDALSISAPLNSMLDVYVNVDSTFSRPEGNKQQMFHAFQSNEESRLTVPAEDILLDLSKTFPDREFYALVADFKGETWFLTRYIAPLNLPQGKVLTTDSQPLEIMMMRMARWVSLIPYESDTINFAGLYDLWSSHEEFISCLLGDDEEHALLLIAYFLQLNVPLVRLVFGDAIGVGSTTWVLSQTDTIGGMILWNPMTGRSYRASDPTCPLHRVTCMADQSNIYYNTQIETHPNRISWDITNWRTLWNSPIEPPLSTIQISTYEYSEPDRNLARRDADKVERHLKEQFREWRRGQITRFKTDVVAQMKSLLQNFEQHQMTVGPNLSPQEAQRLLEPIHNKYSRFEVVGFPLHLPMNDLESVTSAVKSVEMHRSSRAKDFAIAVHVEAYPASVQSLWVYLAQFTPKS